MKLEKLETIGATLGAAGLVLQSLGGRHSEKEHATVKRSLAKVGHILLYASLAGTAIVLWQIKRHHLGA